MPLPHSSLIHLLTTYTPFPCHFHTLSSFTSFHAPFSTSKVLFPEEDPDLGDTFYDGLPEYVMNGDWVRLYHMTTNSLVSCDRNMSLVTRKHYLAYAKAYVSRFGF